MKGLVWAVVLFLIIIILVIIFSGDKFGNDEIDIPAENVEATEGAVNDLKSSGLISSSASVEVKKIEAENWPNACLGIEEVGRFCAQVITPGYEITLEAEDREFIYRTNQDGSFVVLAEQTQ